MARSVDLNCDMGESFGAYSLGNDAEVMTTITSANVACGFHAGDPAVMRATVRLAKAHGVAVGAHPGLPDLVGFGRREMQITADEAGGLVVYQLGALAAIARVEGVALRHVKAHGALYNMAARDRELADAIARAVRGFDPGLRFFALAGSPMFEAAENAGLRGASEVFADRAYEADGSLTSRRLPGAVIHEAAEVAARAVRMVRDGHVIARTGEYVPLRADTICVHGDTPGAASLARTIREALESAGVEVRSFD